MTETAPEADDEEAWSPFDDITYEDSDVWPGPWRWFCDACGEGSDGTYREKHDAVDAAIDHVHPDEGEEPGERDHEVWIRSVLREEMFEMVQSAVKAALL